MSPSTWSYLAGMLALFVGQRILDGIDEWQLAATLGGGALLAVAVFLRVRELRAAKDPGLRLGHRTALAALAVGVGALVLYATTTDRFTAGLHLDDAAEARWLGAMRSLWPMEWLLGTVPLLVIDHGLRSSPVMIPARRVQETAVHGLVAALGLLLVFPLNYVATKRNERWDLAYFKTPTPGTATRALVEALEEPVTVRIFMPPSSEVAEELRTYFSTLEGPKLAVEILDQAASPRLAKALAIRDNGTVALTQGDITELMDEAAEPATPEGETPPEPAEDEAGKPVTKRLRVDPELDKGKKTLKKLDQEVQKMLIELGQGARVAYFTMGHGELNWSTDKEMLDASIRALKTRMTELGFSIKPLGLTEGLGEKIPDDASLVLVLGPRKPFFQAEVDAIGTYLDRGGALLLAREPAPNVEGAMLPSDPLDGLMTRLGVKMGDGVLASERNIVPLSRNRLDAFNIVTNGFTSHSTTRQISERSEQLVLVTPAAGFLEELPDTPNSITFVARSLAYVWADINLNAQFDADAGETKEARNLMAAIEGASEGGVTGFRAVVTADASMFSDLGVGLSLGNQRLAEDTLNWLIGAEALSGTTENEEDVKIEHTKEGQQWWFYLTVLVAPLGVVLLGALRLRLRRAPSPGASATRRADEADKSGGAA